MHTGVYKPLWERCGYGKHHMQMQLRQLDGRWQGQDPGEAPPSAAGMMAQPPSHLHSAVSPMMMTHPHSCHAESPEEYQVKIPYVQFKRISSSNSFERNDLLNALVEHVSPKKWIEWKCLLSSILLEIIIIQYSQLLYSTLGYQRMWQEGSESKGCNAMILHEHMSQAFSLILYTLLLVPELYLSSSQDLSVDTDAILPKFCHLCVRHLHKTHVSNTRNVGALPKWHYIPFVYHILLPSAANTSHLEVELWGWKMYGGQMSLFELVDCISDCGVGEKGHICRFQQQVCHYHQVHWGCCHLLQVYTV